MTDFFGSTDLLVQLTITFFTLGMGLGHLLIGPISDSVGRRKPIFLGLLLQMAMVIVIVHADSVVTLNAARFLQGLGTASMMVPARAMLADCFEGLILKRHLIFIATSFATGLIVAPFMGGSLQYTFGWKSSFIFILIFLIILFTIFIAAVPETLISKNQLSMSKVQQSYCYVFKYPFFMINVFLVSSFLAYSSIFSVVGPFFIQDAMGFSAVIYGYIALLTGACWFIGNMVSRYLEHIVWKKS